MEFIRKIFRNQNFARTNGDKLASSVFLVGGIFAFWYETCHVMSTYKFSTSVQTFHFLVAAWCFVGAVTNWYKMISTRVFPYYVELEAKKQQDWKYCERCFLFSPPRGHHCKICNVCVLKRDHHCWFAGCCVGFRNQRFYLVMLVYIWISALYSNTFNVAFVYDTMDGFGIGSLFSLAFPHGAALIGLVSFYQFCICVVSFLGFLCLVLFSWLLQIQISQIYAGQTKYEKKHNLRDYDLGWRNNIREVLGQRHVLTIFSAFLPSPLPSDGVTFSKQAKDQ